MNGSIGTSLKVAFLLCIFSQSTPLVPQSDRVAGAGQLQGGPEQLYLNQDASKTRPLYPLEMTGQVPTVTTSFGAFGPGSATNPSTYIAGQLHPGIDLRAGAGDRVLAPISGRIVYYHRLRNSPPEERIIDTFLVLRGEDGRDYLLGHVECTVCGNSPKIGDSGTYGPEWAVRVERGQTIARIGDLTAEAQRLGYPSGVASHLHFGITERPIVDSSGRLLKEFRGGNWGRLTYSANEEGNPTSARAKMIIMGYLDPATLWEISKPAPPPTARGTSHDRPSTAHNDVYLSAKVAVVTSTKARERSRPSSNGTSILREIPYGSNLTGRWVRGEDGRSTWLKQSNGGYISNGSLRAQDTWEDRRNWKTPFPPGYEEAYSNYISSLQPSMRSIDWVNLKAGVVSTPKQVWVADRQYLVINGCKPADCGSNKVTIFVDNDTLLTNSVIVFNDRLSAIGQVNAIFLTCYRRLSDSGFQIERC